MAFPLDNKLGNVYGKLFVIARAKNRGSRVYWLCRCVCGKTKEIAADSLKSGNSISCGCEHRGRKPSKLTTPEMSKKRKKYYEELKLLLY